MSGSGEPFVSYAQHGEDVILWRALGDRGPGTYVDVGAFHPTYDSVTRALYERGWRGVNIDAQADRIAAFDTDRPEDRNLGLAIGDEDGTATLTLQSNPGWASLRRADETGAPPDSETITVPLRRLDTLLPELGIAQVDVLKIDVEGAEPGVVRGLLGGTLRPTVCVVEGVAPGVGRAAGDEAVELLRTAGYAHCMFDGLNHYLTVDDSLVDRLSTPANPMDGFVTDLVARLMDERASMHETIAAMSLENQSLRIAHQEPDRAPMDQDATPTVPDGSQLIDGPQAETLADGLLQTTGPASPDPAAMSAVQVAPAPFRGEVAIRDTRRRAAFARLLRGRPSLVAEPVQTLPAQLLALSLGRHTPAVAVAVLYRAVLDREPEAEGVAAWTEQIENGMSPLAVAHLLAVSEEALSASPARRAKVLTDLRQWESFAAVDELGASTWRLGRPTTLGQVANELYVNSLYEVTLHRPPTPGELSHELDKLAAGVGREWLLRAMAARAEPRARFLGTAPGIRGRLTRLRDGRGYLTTVRNLVAAAESRQVKRFLADMAGAPLAADEIARLTRKHEEH